MAGKMGHFTLCSLWKGTFKWSNLIDFCWKEIDAYTAHKGDAESGSLTEVKLLHLQTLGPAGSEAEYVFPAGTDNNVTILFPSMADQENVC